MSKYLEEAERVLKLAQKGKGLARIDYPCSKCKFHRLGFVSDTCTNPVVVLAAAQADDPYAAEALQRTDQQRGTSSPYGSVVCGPDATLFEAKPKPWWRW